jgi:hypothetical protein
VTGVGQAVEVDELVDGGMNEETTDQVGSDEATAAGDQEIHGILRFIHRFHGLHG